MNKLCVSEVRRPSFVLLFLGVFTLLSACAENAITSSNQLSPEATALLQQRVTQRWHAMEVKDFGQTYGFTTPNYRSVFPKALYVNNFSYAVDWELTGVEVVNYDAQAAVASVAVRVMSKPAKQTSAASIAMGALPVTLHEKWIRVNGQWWHSTKVK